MAFTSFTRKMKMDEVMVIYFQVIAHVRMVELVVSVFLTLHLPGFILHQSLVIDTDSVSEFSHS